METGAVVAVLHGAAQGDTTTIQETVPEAAEQFAFTLIGADSAACANGHIRDRMRRREPEPPDLGNPWELGAGIVWRTPARVADRRPGVDGGWPPVPCPARRLSRRARRALRDRAPIAALSPRDSAPLACRHRTRPATMPGRTSRRLRQPARPCLEQRRLHDSLRRLDHLRHAAQEAQFAWRFRSRNARPLSFACQW
jgi:hypothetical protein